LGKVLLKYEHLLTEGSTSKLLYAGDQEALIVAHFESLKGPKRGVSALQG